MCTCGIDMATQQPRPATTSSACSSAGETEMGCTARWPFAPRQGGDGCRPAQHQHQRHHDDQADDADGRIGEAPALGPHHIGHDERPEGAGQVVSGSRRRHRDAAPAHEPVRNVGDQRTEDGRRAGADQHALHHRELDDRRGQRGQQETAAECNRGDQRRSPVADPVDGAADDDVAQRKADHGRRVGQRRIGPVDAELRLHGGQHHHDSPHADAADSGEQHADGEPQPGIGAVDVGAAVADLCGSAVWRSCAVRSSRRGSGRSVAGRQHHKRISTAPATALMQRVTVLFKTTKKAGTCPTFPFVAMPLPTNLPAAAGDEMPYAACRFSAAILPVLVSRTTS